MPKSLAQSKGQVNSPRQRKRHRGVFGATIRTVTDDDVLDVLRAWVYKRFSETHWSQAKFCQTTGIKQGDFSRALRGDSKTITWLMLRRIGAAAELKTSLAQIMSQLGEAFAVAEYRVSIGQPAVPVAELPPEKATPGRRPEPKFEAEEERRAIVDARRGRKPSAAEQPPETQRAPRAKKNH
jgi:transcriptional regulator with XRE-family HTH domain